MTQTVVVCVHDSNLENEIHCPIIGGLPGKYFMVKLATACGLISSYTGHEVRALW